MFLVSSLYRDVSFSYHLFQVCIFFIFFIFYFDQASKNSWVFQVSSVLYRKITWFIWRKKKTSSLHRDETTIFTWFIWRKTFLQDFLRYTNKINGVSVFVSIPHCPMDYCIPPYSTVFIEQGFACNSVE